MYLTGRHLELTDAVREHVQRHLVQPLTGHNRLKINRLEIQLFKDAERGHHFGCHLLVDLAGQPTINIRERDPDLLAAIDLARARALVAFTEIRDRLLTLSRHPKKYSLERIARALGWTRRGRVPT